MPVIAKTCRPKRKEVALNQIQDHHVQIISLPSKREAKNSRSQTPKWCEEEKNRGGEATQNAGKGEGSFVLPE
jgi:hypothetical protein